MTVDELKVVITADDSKFSKAINKVKNAIKGVASVNVGKGLDNSTVSVDKFRNNYLRAMRDFEKSTNKTSKAVRDAWTRELDYIVQKTETKLEYLSKQFATSGYADSWGAQIDETDAYYRKLKDFQKLVNGGLIDVDTGDLDKIPQIVEEATASIESMDARINATIDINGVEDLKDTDRIILLIKDALREIENLKVEPITKETLAIIKQYRKEIDTLVGQWGKLNKYSTKNLAYSAFQTQQPELFRQIQNTANIRETKEKKDRNEPDFGKAAGTITRALIGVRSLFFFVRKIASQNEYLQFAVGAMFETIAGALKPVLDFIANIIIGISKIIGRIFGVAVGISGSASSTAGNTEKMLTIASFDELETLNRAVEGGSGSAGAEGGYDSLLKKIDDKLGGIYKLIDKLKGTIEKADLPDEDDIVEGVIASGAAGSQSPSGIGFSWGTNKDNSTIEGVYEAWEDTKVDWVVKQIDKIKTWWGTLRENIVNNNQAITDDTRLQTDSQVEKWKGFIDRVKEFWGSLKEKLFGDNSEIVLNNLLTSHSMLEAWDNLKEGAKNKWQEIKNKIIGDNAEIAQNNLSLSEILSNAWENIKINATEKWNNLKTTISQKLEDIKSKIRGVPDALSGWASSAWWYVRNFANNIISGIESAINNIIWKINNSGLANVLNKVFGGGFYVSPIWIPRLAKGGVLDTPTIAQMGEYPGAHSNKEIVTPQNLLTQIIRDENDGLADAFVQVGRQIVDAINGKDMSVSIDDTTIAKSAQRGNRQWQLQTGNSLF